LCRAEFIRQQFIGFLKNANLKINSCKGTIGKRFLFRDFVAVWKCGVLSLTFLQQKKLFLRRNSKNPSSTFEWIFLTGLDLKIKKIF